MEEDRQCNGRRQTIQWKKTDNTMVKRKRTNNDPQNTTQKIID
jgi:hypothetical protein